MLIWAETFCNWSETTVGNWSEKTAHRERMIFFNWCLELQNVFSMVKYNGRQKLTSRKKRVTHDMDKRTANKKLLTCKIII